MATLYNAETELNNDLTNGNAVRNYISTAHSVAKKLDAKYEGTWVSPGGNHAQHAGVITAQDPAPAPKTGALSKAQIKRELLQAVKAEPAGSRVQVGSSEEAAASSTEALGSSFRDINEVIPANQFEEGIEEVEAY